MVEAMCKGVPDTQALLALEIILRVLSMVIRIFVLGLYRVIKIVKVFKILQRYEGVL